MWIARDKNGSLFIYEHKPIRLTCTFFGAEEDEFGIVGTINESTHPEVTWENSPKELVVKED